MRRHVLESKACRPEEDVMAKGEQRGNRETKKPKKEVVKTIAANPSTKGGSTTVYGKK
jgi:hypothetical protein